MKVGKDPKVKNGNLKFSFEYYDTSGKYCMRDWGSDKIAKTLGRLKEINQKNFHEMIRDSRTYHFYPNKWEKMKEKCYPSTAIMNFETYHFALVGVNNKKARVYGAYNDGTFYIVWFDLEHMIWPTFAS